MIANEDAWRIDLALEADLVQGHHIKDSPMWRKMLLVQEFRNLRDHVTGKP